MISQLSQVPFPYLMAHRGQARAGQCPPSCCKNILKGSQVWGNVRASRLSSQSLEFLPLSLWRLCHPTEINASRVRLPESLPPVHEFLISYHLENDKTQFDGFYNSCFKWQIQRIFSLSSTAFFTMKCGNMNQYVLHLSRIVSIVWNNICRRRLYKFCKLMWATTIRFLVLFLKRHSYFGTSQTMIFRVNSFFFSFVTIGKFYPASCIEIQMSKKCHHHVTSNLTAPIEINNHDTIYPCEDNRQEQISIT